jgi:polyhydroxybutyrate depolymerase
VAVSLRPTLLGGLALACLAACSSVELYPITRDAPSGAAGSGGANSGSGGSGGSNQGGEGLTPQCNTPPRPPGDSQHTLTVDGASRSYVLHLPPGYDGASAASLVVDFHGIGETGASERRTSPYPAALDAEGVIMAFPDGLRGPAGTGWNVGPCCVKNVDDVAFARAVVAHAQTVACVDPTRVYAVGVLTGGGMAHYVACRAADLFAGVGTAAFDLLAENIDDCIPARPITVISFRSLLDPRVPYAGGESSLVPGMPLTFLGAKKTFEAWAEINRCTTGPSSEDASGCSAFTGCAGGTEVRLCTRDGEQQQSDPSVVWPVLRAHTL